MTAVIFLSLTCAFVGYACCVAAGRADEQAEKYWQEQGK